MFNKILIANRGEIAARILRACKKLGIKAVCVFSEADEKASYLKDADETICIGPAPAGQSYLNQDALIDAAIKTEVQALHPGYGFLSENALFATRCLQQKIEFIGPRPHHIRMMGDKANARETMKRLGLPTINGTDGLLQNVEQARTCAEQLGYPVLLKATAGGGGKGMRAVLTPSQLADAYMQASTEAGKAFGNSSLYLEKLIEGARHIEFQVLADKYGHVIHLGERDCSIQRNHQKLIEEAPAPGFDPKVRQQMGEQICRVLERVGYLGAGTLEFLMDQTGKLYFMEMNTRLQVEHPVTELVTGIDIVEWQIRIAVGEPLSIQQEDVHWNGSAIECRINAEDPDNGFKPSPGTVSLFKPPKNSEQGPVRLESHVQTGYTIAPYYDSMIGKLIGYGSNREQAVKVLSEALDSFEIEGIATTLPFHRSVLAQQDFMEGRYNCQFLENHPKQFI